MVEITFLVNYNYMHLDNARVDMWERECGVYVATNGAKNSRFTAVSLFSFEFNLINVYRIYASILGNTVQSHLSAPCLHCYYGYCI